MSTDKIGPNKKDATTVSSELTEEQLNSVSGGGSKTTPKTGTKGGQQEYLTITLTDVLIS